MRIIIYGAGGIGCVVGGRMALTGQKVILVGRPGHIQAINNNGLKLETTHGIHNLKLPAFISPKQVNFMPDDVVFLSVKGPSTEEAIRDLRAVVQDVPIFCFQNKP